MCQIVLVISLNLVISIHLKHVDINQVFIIITTLNASFICLVFPACDVTAWGCEQCSGPRERKIWINS